MLELAITAPVLLLLALGLFDVSRILITHLTLTQYAREGVRVSSREKSLEVGEFTYDCRDVVASRVCSDIGYSDPCTFAVTQRRVLSTICNRIQDPAVRRTLFVVPDTIFIRTFFDFYSDTINFSVETDYDGFFSPFRGRRIQVAAVGPYL